MKYLIFFILLLSLSVSAPVQDNANKSSNNKDIIETINAKKESIDITNNMNPVVDFCKKNGGTFNTKTKKCALPNNINYDAWFYWGYHADEWDGVDRDYFDSHFF